MNNPALNPQPVPDEGPLRRSMYRESAVVLRDISKAYDGRTVIAELSLVVLPGEFLAIIGPSGSGKTTLMRMIGGFEAPDSGQVFIAGEDVTGLPAERRRVNTVFQSYALFPHMTVLENVAFGPRMRGVPRLERLARARELLELVHLPGAADRRPSELSGGMQQRVALARALANDPAVLLLDEPLGALDRKLREEMQRELRRVQAALGATFIYVTHDQEEAFGMADRVAVMREGRFAQIGDPASVYDRPDSAWVARFTGTVNLLCGTYRTEGGRLLVEGAFGRIAADRATPGLAAGQPAVALFRPEAAQVVVRKPGESADCIRLAARLADVVVVGPALRLRLVTEDGTELEAVTPRTAGPAAGLGPGDPVWIGFAAGAVQAFRPEEESSELEPLSERNAR